MRYHNITKDDMLNGDGLRVVLWVSGCSHCCKGCQNPITWDVNGGVVFDESAKQEIFDQLDKPYISGITFSGGDPLHSANRMDVRTLMAEIREKYPDKTIWCYTGYTWEELMDEIKVDDTIKVILDNIDVLLDGKFILKLALEKLQYVGSRNQCIIDVKKSLKENKKVLYIDNNKILEGE